MANRFDQFTGGAAPAEEDAAAAAAPTDVPRITVTPANRFEPFAGGSAPAFPGPKASFDQFSPERFNKPFGELKADDPTPTERFKRAGQDAFMSMGASPYNARQLSEKYTTLGSMFTPMGSVLSAADLTHDLPRGNYGAAALDALGAIPGATAVRRVLPEATFGRLASPQPTVIPAYAPPFRETRRGEPDIGGFVTPTETELRSSGRAGYRSIEQAPLVYHPNAIAEMTDWARNTLPNPRFGPVFTPETAPNTHAMLERFGMAFPRGGPRPVHAYDFDALRQQLLSQSGVEAAAGRQAADVLDTFMLNPPQGMMVQGRDLLPALRETYGAARGDWRALKTSEGVTDAIDAARIGAAGEHSGKNLGNRTRQEFQKYVKTPAGEEKLFGATPGELNAIEDVAAGDWWTNKLRAGSNRLGGGGGWGQATTAGFGGAAGGGLAHMLGLDPASTVAMTVAGAGVPMAAGGAMRRAANARTTAAAEEVAANIRRNSPLYRERAALPENQPITDPRSFARDAITMALMPGARDLGTKQWNELYMPYENRE